MKVNLLIVGLSSLFLFSLIGPAPQAAAQDDYRAYREMQKSPVRQELQKRIQKASILSRWNGLGGNGIILRLLREPDFRAELGVSEEQYERIQEMAKDMRDPQKNPELKKIYEEIEAIETANGDTLQDADEATKQRFFDLQDKMYGLTITTGSDGLNVFTIANALEATLTQEQKQKIKEVQLAASLSENSIFSPNRFEALGLTDAQRQEMEKIKEKLESEFGKPLEDLVNRAQILQNKLLDECEKKGWQGINFDVLDAETRKEIMEGLDEISNETQSHGEQFS